MQPSVFGQRVVIGESQHRPVTAAHRMVERPRLAGNGLEQEAVYQVPEFRTSSGGERKLCSVDHQYRLGPHLGGLGTDPQQTPAQLDGICTRRDHDADTGLGHAFSFSVVGQKASEHGLT